MLSRLTYGLFFLPLFICSCRKEDSSFINTMSAEVNGIAWKNDAIMFGSDNPWVGQYMQEKLISGVGYLTKDFKRETFITLHLKHMDGIGDYVLGLKDSPDDNVGYAEVVIREPDTTRTYLTGGNNGGIVTISMFDSAKHHIVGKFQLGAANDSSIRSEVSITNGQFDIIYKE